MGAYRPQSIASARAIGVLLLVACTTSPAETLEQAWEQAMTTDQTLRAAIERTGAADAMLAGARAERRALLSTGATMTRFDTTPAFDFSGIGVQSQLALFGGQSWLMADARASVPVYTGGRIGAGIDAAAADLDMRESESAALALDVKLDVAERYIAVLRTESALTVANANVASLSAHARDVEDMYRTGQVPRNDSLAATVALVDAEQQALKARGALDVARAAYNRSIGRELDAAVALDAELPPIDPDLTAASVEGLIELALASRNELESIAAAADSLAARSLAAKAATRPQLLFSGGYSYLENDFLNRSDFWSIGLAFQWNLLDSGRSRNASAALSRQAAAARSEQANLQSLIGLAVQEAWLNVEETRERIAVTVGAVSQSEENLRVARDRYRNGEGTNTEVLDAEALWQLSRSNYDSARYDAALARFRLARAVGFL